LKIPDINILFFSKSTKWPLVIVFLALLPLAGCNIIGFLLSPGPFEEKVPPKYDLKANQDRKILLIVECPRSSGVDFDINKKLKESMEKYLTGIMKIETENLIVPTSDQDKTQSRDPLKAARDVGAGYVLVLQVDNYRLKALDVRDYYVGEMRSRAILMDTDLGEQVWPKEPQGKVVQVGVDLETEGRDMAVARLLSTTAHCAMRELYPCEKLKYKNSDEVMTLQDAMEMETF
jgi:hypothetical protein